jgi:FtsP/CotA-like multicopper oxidase with cupredoxin domain
MRKIQPDQRSAGAARLLSAVAIAAALLLAAPGARATIITVPGPGFDLTANAGYVSMPDGGSIYSWGYGNGNGAAMQLPGPSLEVTAGQVVTVTLHNALPAAAGNTSIVFPGHVISSTIGGVPGLLTQEAPPGGSVQYTFTAGKPGTYQYHSGTRPDLQVEMGLYGTLIVRPAAAPPVGCTAWAYDHLATCYDREYLFLISEIDIDVHVAAEAAASGPGPMDVPTEPYRSEYWLFNGRAAPDTMAAAGAGLFPMQPYNCLPKMHPGEKLLMRVVGVGRQMHPFHHHGNHARILARDGNLILSATDPTKLAGPLVFTIPSLPGGTVDAVFEWTGKDLGWDIYGTADFNPHACTPDANGYHNVPTDPNYREWCADHYRPIPVTLPDLSVLTFGGFWGGSPYLGVFGSLPPGEGGLNPNYGYTFMWHSHTERELTNNDIFPGGMMTMLIVEAPSVPID